MIVLVKLLLAHLIGDFLLQPTAWVLDKEAKKHKSIYLYFHVLLHGILAFVLIFEKNFLWFALLLAVLHGVIDYMKLQFQTKKTKRFWFLLDQFLHAITLVGIAFFYTNTTIDFSFFGNNFWIILTGIVFLTLPVSKIIYTILILCFSNNKKYKNNSLSRAGHYIGILERILIFCFIISNHFEAIGFLLATKSIFRFGELKDINYREQSEYYFIGTLLSFGIALLIGLLVQLAIF
jgi:hypothetical protein